MSNFDTLSVLTYKAFYFLAIPICLRVTDNIFIAEWVTTFLTDVNFTDRKCNWFLLLVLKSCNNELVLNVSKLLNTKTINEKRYKHGSGKIFSFANQPSQ
jgi:hypothetical protein